VAEQHTPQRPINISHDHQHWSLVSQRISPQDTQIRPGLTQALSRIIILSPVRQTAVARIGADTTYDYSLPIIWSEVEAGAVLLCSCLPSFRQALQPLWARHLCPSAHPGSNNTNAFALPFKAEGLHWRRRQSNRITGTRSLSRGRKRKKNKPGTEGFARITPMDRAAWIDSLAFQAVWLKGGQLGTRSHVEAAPTPSPAYTPDSSRSWLSRWKRGSFDGGVSTQDSTTPIKSDEAMMTGGNGGAEGIMVTREFTYEVEEVDEMEMSSRKKGFTAHVRSIGDEENRGTQDRSGSGDTKGSAGQSVVLTGSSSTSRRPSTIT
jgi:hypothetical protein